ncbi:MAG: hypothetical protein ACOYY2_03895 [Actinomycetota bacterium]
MSQTLQARCLSCTRVIGGQVHQVLDAARDHQDEEHFVEVVALPDLRIVPRDLWL